MLRLDARFLDILFLLSLVFTSSNFLSVVSAASFLLLGVLLSLLELLLLLLLLCLSLCGVLLVVKRLGLGLIMRCETLLRSLLILTNLIIIIGDFVNVESLTHSLSGRHSTLIVRHWVWTNLEASWLHGRI